jgi:PKD repeat protein
MKLRFYISFLFAFFIYISALKAQITLISPKNNTVTTNPITRFTWNTTNYAAQYVFQISTTEDFSSIIYSTSVNAGFIDYTLPLPTENRNFFWRVRQSNMVEWTEFSKITLISLVNFSSIKGWYAADSNVIKDISNNVENWQDISVNANNVLQSNQTEKPTFIPTRQIINNKPTIKFTSDLSQIKTLNFSNQLALTDFTMLLVRNHVPSDFAAQYVVAGVDNGILSEINALNAGFGHYRFTQYRFSNTASVNQQFSIYTHKNNLIRRNGIESSLAYGSITPSLLLDKIGTRTDFPNAAFKGELAELIIFNGSIPLDSLEVLEQYLRFKYAPPVNLGKDTIFGNSFCDTMRLYAGNNFSSYLWSTGETTESIKATSDKNYSVLVRDIFGYESSDNITVLPYKKLSGKTVYLCKGDTLKLNLGLPVGFNAQWSNGVNSSSISLSQEGVYSVLITDSKGCKFNDTIKIIINQYNYSPELISQQLTICEGEKLFLLSNIPIDSIRWSTGSTQDFTTFTSSGSQNVYAKTVTGCIIKDTFVVNVAGKAPVAKFGYSPVCQNSEVNFLDSSIAPLGNSITSWKWNFSNNVSSSIQNPMTTFTNLGIATASLKVVTNSGCTDSIAKTIVVNRKPSPSFFNLLSCAGVATTFVDQSVANAAAITNWNWDFAGLGTVNGIQNPLFEFPSSGVYGVKLTATNSNSCSDTVTILTRVNASPVSNFSFDSVCGKTAVTLKFLATVESPSVIPDINWGSWDFGDGNIETAIRNPQHVYDTPGSYDV